MPERSLFSIEIRRFLEEPRNMVLLAAAIIVPPLSLWPYIASPWLPAFAATFACLEPYYMNMWCLWPGQFESLAVRPIRWHQAIAVKNVTALSLTLCVFVLFSLITYYVQPGPLAASDFAAALLQCLIAGMALVIFGNNYSIVSPRPRIGWTLSDMAASILSFAIAAAALLPVLVLSSLVGTWTAHGALLLLASVVWVQWSLPGTAARLQQHIPEIWTNATYS